MNTKIINLDNINLHLIECDNFKTTRVEARFILNISKKEVPILELLSNALIYSTKKYNTRKAFIDYQKDLYDTIITSNIADDGNRTSLEISMSFLDNKYSYDNLLFDEINFLNEILYNPNISDNKYDEDTFEAVKLNVISYLEALKEDKGKYSRMKLYELVNEGRDDFISQVSEEYYNIVKNATREDVVDLYEKIINESQIDIIVLGNINIADTEKMFKRILSGKASCKSSINPIRLYEKNKKVVTRFESDKSNQAKLNIACTVDNNLSKYEKEVVMQVYNLILGGFANSLFFKNIREKHSLCYYVSTNYSYYDNLLLIRSGINKDNYEKMMTLIKKEMKSVLNGSFELELLEEAKKTYVSILKSSMDYPSSLINNYYDNQIDGISLFQDRLSEIMKVTKDDVIKLAEKVSISSVYMFGGDLK